MAYAVSTQTTTAADGLRDALVNAERLIVKLSSDNVEEFLLLLDAVEARFGQLAEENEGLDLRPEEARWESLLRRLRAKPGLVAAPAAGRAGGLRALRAAHGPAAGFWWRLDEAQQAARGRALRRFVLGGMGLILLLAGGSWLVNRFFPPDPTAVLLMESQSAIDNALYDRDFAAARAGVQAARQKLPAAPELAVWEAVLSERLGEEAEAARLLDEARGLMPEPAGDEAFWLLVGNDRLQAGDLTGAEEAANRAIEANSASAQGYFLLASVADAEGERARAIELFDRTFVLAEPSNPQLAVIARVRMGQLLQVPDFLPTRTPAAATPTS